MAQLIQEEVHTMETEDLAPIHRQEEAHVEEDHLEAIHLLAIDTFLHLHHSAHPLSRQEELVNRQHCRPRRTGPRTWSNCAFCAHKCETQHMPYSTVELLMFFYLVTCYQGKEKARCWRNEVYAEDRAPPLLPLERVANLWDTKFVWENGHALRR